MSKGGKNLKKQADKTAGPKTKKVILKVRKIGNSQKGAERQMSSVDKEFAAKKQQREIVTRFIGQEEAKRKSKKKDFLFKKNNKPGNVNLLKERLPSKPPKKKENILNYGLKSDVEQSFIGGNREQVRIGFKKNVKQIDYNKLEKDKRLILISGVTFFMVLILFFWVYNIKNMFKDQVLNNAEETKITDWELLTNEIGDSIKNIKDDIVEIKTFADTASTTLSATSSQFKLPDSGQASSSREISEAEINNLKTKLEEISQE
ncbi:MAG: hypothetical protein U9R06_00020 [Patescibacteria group bacterium]|nr:hypothetical protein [Patescibacteria group bacterium]